MKKIYVLITVVLFVLLFLCTTAFAVPPHPGARPLKVAVVVPASSTDQGWNQMGVDGLRVLWFQLL